MNDRVHPEFQPAIESMRGPEELFDRADEMEVDECRLAHEWRQQQDDEREMRLEDALNECLARGVSTESLKILCFESGATHWALVNSLKS